MPGITAAELDVMEAAVGRFLAGPGATAPAEGTMQELRALREPAGRDGAGAVSASRSSYFRQRGTHFMYMRHRAG